MNVLEYARMYNHEYSNVFLEYFTPDDVEKLEIIKREVLMTEATREQRKARVSKYRRWVSYRDQNALNVQFYILPTPRENPNRPSSYLICLALNKHAHSHIIICLQITAMNFRRYDYRFAVPLYGEVPPKRVTFSRLQVYERVTRALEA